MDEFSNAEPRPLSWDLKFQAAMSANTGTDEGDVSLFVWPEDPDERTLILFSLSQHEYTAIASAIDVGSDIAFGVDAIKVWWLFVKNMRYNVPICAAIIECINTDADTQAALADYLATNELARAALQQLIDNGSIITTPTTTIVQTDDLDALFGAITYLVDTMNGANIDLYEALEASTNKRELGQILFEAIPVVETLPFDEASEYIDTLAEDVAEGYNAEYTTTPVTGMRDRLRCALFCLARAHGNALTWNLIAGYFWGEVGFTPGDYIDTFVDFVNFFLSGSWVGDEIVLISFGNIASVLSTTQKFSEMTFPSLSGIMKLGQNDPDPDWAILCEDCPSEWEEDFDFKIDDQGWSIIGNQVPGVGIQSPGTGGTPYTVQVAAMITWTDGTLTRVIATVSSTTADGGAFRGVYWPASANPPQIGYTSNTGNYTIDIVPNNPQPEIIAIQVSNASVPGTNTIITVTLRGTGTNPFA